jgi:hypothetical protein
MALLRIIITATGLMIPTVPAVAGSNSASMFVTNVTTGAGLFFGHAAAPLPPLPVRPEVHRWDDFVAEAAFRFGIPADWIRDVMGAESDGRAFLDGAPIVSRAGAIGLMQIMPETYVELKRRYGLGDDPTDPHDNILAGAAYLRELYNRFGAPDFLAAYNAGPARMEAYRAGVQPLPDETSRYLDKLGPSLIADLPSDAAVELAALRDSHGLFASGPLFFTVKERPDTPPVAP